MRLARDPDQVAHGRGRGEHHRVHPAALERLPDRGRRRRGPHRTVRRDVVDVPAAVLQAGHQGLGGDVGPGQQHPVERIEHVVVLGPVGEQALTGLLAGGNEVRADTEGAQGVRSRLADRGHLDAGERPRVQAALLDLLLDGLDRVDRGEGHPLVASRHQAGDRAFHGCGRPRRLHRDRGHLQWTRAVRAQQIRQDRRLLLRPGHQHRPAEQRARLPPGQLVTGCDRGTDRHHHAGGVRDDGCRVGLDPVQGGGDRALVGRGAVHRHRHGGVTGPAVFDQCRRHLADLVRDRGHHEGAGCLGERHPVDVRAAGPARGVQASAEPTKAERRTQWRGPQTGTESGPAQARAAQARAAQAGTAETGTAETGQAASADATGHEGSGTQPRGGRVRHRGHVGLHTAGGEDSQRAREGDRKAGSDPGVGGDRRAGRNPRHDPERNLRLGQCLRVGSTDSGQPWVRGIQPHDPLTGTSPGDDRGGRRVRVQDWSCRLGIADPQHLTG